MSARVPRIVIESANFIMMLFLIASSYLIIMGAGALYEDHQRVMNQTVQTVPEPSKREIAKAHRYHGVDWSWQDGEECYFKDKQGRTCKLFGSKK